MKCYEEKNEKSSYLNRGQWIQATIGLKKIQQKDNTPLQL